jgi:hypothetical protein
MTSTFVLQGIPARVVRSQGLLGCTPYGQAALNTNLPCALVEMNEYERQSCCLCYICFATDTCHTSQKIIYVM